MTMQHYAQYDQVFVILRVDTFADTPTAPEAAIGLVKALWSAAAAEAEVTRLTQLNRAPGTVYFWKAARLMRRLADSDTHSTLALAGQATVSGVAL